MPAPSRAATSRAARGDGADQLLEVERVAVGALDDARRPPSSATSPSASRTSFSLARRDSGAEADRLQRARLPQIAGSARRPRGAPAPAPSAAVAQVAQRGVDEADRAGDRPSAGPRAPAAPGARRTRRRASPPRRGAWRRPSAAGSRARRAARRCRRRGRRRRPARRGTRRPARGARASTWRATRARSLSRLLSTGSPSWMPAARRMARPSMPNGEPAPSESPRRTAPRRGRAGAATQRGTRARRRDLPTPAGPMTSTAAAIDSASAAA